MITSKSAASAASNKALDSPNVYIAGFEADFGPHGYMGLRFDGARLHESVHAPQGAAIYDAPVL